MRLNTWSQSKKMNRMTKWIKNQKFRKHVSKEAIQVKLGSPDQLESGLQVWSNLESIFRTEFSPLKEIILKWKYLLASRIYFITVEMRNQTMFAHNCSFWLDQKGPVTNCLSVGSDQYKLFGQYLRLHIYKRNFDKFQKFQFERPNLSFLR